MTLPQLKALCVDPFAASSTRTPIFDGLQKLLAELAANSVAGDVWVDGSFITKKLDPKDCDFVLACDGGLLAGTANTTLQDYLKSRFAKKNMATVKAQFMCDAYYFPVYTALHTQYGFTLSQGAYWKRQFGHDRNKCPKGIAVLTLPVAP